MGEGTYYLYYISRVATEGGTTLDLTLTTHSKDTLADDTLNPDDTETLTTHCADRFPGQICSLFFFPRENWVRQCS